ncbi:MAG: GGDEF domain-containing protein [Proteobacteria bacterium]|nr:GGDEF domain-containing protein [Pseudomonadota bacterium]HQR04932.1 GGDEF domain-containing protein [Rhodocyclaceae bacterium]
MGGQQMQARTETWMDNGSHWILDLVEQRHAARYAAWVMFVVIALFDWLTGAELTMGPFYLVPLFLVGMRDGWRATMLMSLLAVAMSIIIGLRYGHRFSSEFFFYFSVFGRLMYYTAFMFLIELLRNAFLIQVKMADRDALTGLLNRRALFRTLDFELARTARGKQPVSLLFVDCDNFKGVNDSQGHAAGDEVLKAVAITLRSELRTIDIVARLGGDEFVIVLPDTTGDAMLTVAQKVQSVLTAAMERDGWPVTFSIGAHSVPASDTRDAESLIAKSDLAMYLAKRQGKNQIVVA